jgi:hypothetical protein
MSAIDRWRKWQPSEEKFEKSPGCEPPKPPQPTFEGFEGTTLGQLQDFSVGVTEASDAWREDFNRWKAENCAHSEGRDDSGAIGYLWVDFCEWAVEHGSVPCQRRTFERLLQDAAFPLKDGMAAGLLLRADLEAVLRDDGAGGVRADLSAEPQLRVGNAIGPARLRLSGVTVLRSSDFKRLIAMLNLTMRRF